MRAWVAGTTPGIEALALDDVARPDPEDGKLLVRVCRAALNFSDLLMIDERYQVRPPRPFIPGQEIAGIVEAAPEGSAFAAGDRIVSKVLWGGFADYVNVREDMAIAVPVDADLAVAVALPVSYVTAVVALDYCTSVQAGQTVLVHAAAGGAGLACVEVAAARGAKVIATAGGPDRLAIARNHGAAGGIDYREDDWFQQVKALTDGRGADVIVDPVGGKIGEDSLRCLAMDGTLLIVGFSSGKMPNLAANRLLLKRASAKGVYWNHDSDAAMLAKVNRELTALMSSGAIRPVVDDRYRLADLPRALDDLANRRVTGKIALRVDANGEIDD